MALEGLGRVSVSRDSARPLPRLLPARGLFLLLLLILISGFPHPCSPRGGALGCQPHRFQASFLENLWTVSLFLSLLKSRSQCCLGSVANHGPMRVPVPTVTLHVGLALRATTAPRHHRQGSWFSGKEWSGRWPNRCVCQRPPRIRVLYYIQHLHVPPLSDRASTVSFKSRGCVLAMRPAITKAVEGNDDMSRSPLPGVTHCAGPSTISLRPNCDNSQQPRWASFWGFEQLSNSVSWGLLTSFIQKRKLRT